MRVPDRLLPLLDSGTITEVLRPLMSGKEADVYLVDTPDGVAVAKVYKEATQRSFKHRADYLEGRRSRNTRSQRAMARRSRFGREQIEDAWRSAEVDAIDRCRAAGVRVPEPLAFEEGVLVMELVADEAGQPAPRLVDVDLSKDEAEDLLEILLRDLIRMLLAGVVHGDLSDFNILLAHDGPVIIDLPQATDPAFNRSARKLFLRDVDNVTSFLARYSGRLKKKKYGLEIWDLYERNALDVDTPLTGRPPKRKKAEVSSLLAEMEALERQANERLESAGIERKAKFKPKPVEAPPPAEPRSGKRKRKRNRRKKGRGDADGKVTPPSPPAGPLSDLDALLVVEDDD